MSSLPVSRGQLEYVEKFTELVGAAFAKDVLARTFIAEQAGLAAADEVTPAQVAARFGTIVRESVENGGEIIEAGSWTAAALWRPPQTNAVPTPGSRTGLPGEYTQKRDALREKFIGGRPFWVLHIIGRHPEGKTAGAIRAVIEPYLERARSEKTPIWLEATNTHARDVYAHFGFRVVEPVTIGADSAYPSITVYGMIFEP